MASLNKKKKDILTQEIMTVNWEIWENEDFKLISTIKIRLLQYLGQKEIKHIVSM